MNIIETVNLTKIYGEMVVNCGVNFCAEEGKITAIVGENGAGKTTLMNMLYGLTSKTSGEIFVKGKKTNFLSPSDAIKSGLGMVHQHFKLVPSITVFENILLGIEIKKKIACVKTPFIDCKKEKASVDDIIKKFNFDLKSDERIENLAVGSMQRVEILKMLYRDVDILIFDEPTAVLTPKETDELLTNLRSLKKQGKTIILITHKLREVMEISDNVYVLKRGKMVFSSRTKDTNPKKIASMMVGRDVLIDVNKEHKDSSKNKVAYRVSSLSVVNDSGHKCVNNISFEIREGEILGIAGIEGNGQSELMKALTGLMDSQSGSISLYDEDITNLWSREIRSKKIAIVPEDRYREGLCKDMKVSENIIAGYHACNRFCRFGIMQKDSIKKNLDELVSKFDIRLSSDDCKVSNLSGGNAQKIIIAREMSSSPKVLLVSQPTRGVDIGCIEFIYKKILELREENKAMLLISSELSEIIKLSDRIIVIYKGEIIGELSSNEATSEKIGILMTGISA